MYEAQELWLEVAQTCSDIAIDVAIRKHCILYVLLSLRRSLVHCPSLENPCGVCLEEPYSFPAPMKSNTTTSS